MDKLICQICGEKLPINPDCPCVLGEHLLNKHPDVEMVHFSHQDIHCECSTSAEELLPKSTKSSKFSFKPSSIKKEPSVTRSSVFKTTVETWKPGPLKVICPYCQNIDRPCIRQQRNRVAHSSLGALCLIICWPICFLPFFLPSGSQIELYCRKCGTFLGEYNRKTGKIKCPPCNNLESKNAKDLPIC